MDKSRAKDVPASQAPESWARRISSWIAATVWCLFGALWNLAVFSGIIRAIADGQSLSLLIFIPFSLIGLFLLIVFFTGIGVSLDFLFQTKDETIPRPPESFTLAPPKLAPAQPLEPVTPSDNSGFEMKHHLCLEFWLLLLSLIGLYSWVLTSIWVEIPLAFCRRKTDSF